MQVALFETEVIYQLDVFCFLSNLVYMSTQYSTMTPSVSACTSGASSSCTPLWRYSKTWGHASTWKPIIPRKNNQELNSRGWVTRKKSTSLNENGLYVNMRVSNAASSISQKSMGSNWSENNFMSKFSHRSLTSVKVSDQKFYDNDLKSFMSIFQADKQRDFKFYAEFLSLFT